MGAELGACHTVRKFILNNNNNECQQKDRGKTEFLGTADSYCPTVPSSDDDDHFRYGHLVK